MPLIDSEEARVLKIRGVELGVRYAVADSDGIDGQATLLVFSESNEGWAAPEALAFRRIEAGGEFTSVAGLEHEHLCVTQTDTERNENNAACYVSRDDVLIFSSASAPSTADLDALLQRTVDLAQALNEAYDQVGHPAVPGASS